MVACIAWTDMTGPLEARDVDALVRPVRQAPGGSDGRAKGEEA